MIKVEHITIILDPPFLPLFQINMVSTCNLKKGESILLPFYIRNRVPSPFQTQGNGWDEVLEDNRSRDEGRRDLA